MGLCTELYGELSIPRTILLILLLLPGDLLLLLLPVGSRLGRHVLCCRSRSF